MKKYMILSALGKDRGGIINDISTFLFEMGANLEDSQMAALGGQFSIMCLFTCTLEQLNNIEDNMNLLYEKGLVITLYESEEPKQEDEEDTNPLKISVKSMDNPGIVQKIVHVLHSHKANVNNLNTKVSHAPFFGAPLFNLSLEAKVPFDVPIKNIKADIANLEKDMGIDVTFH